MDTPFSRIARAAAAVALLSGATGAHARTFLDAYLSMPYVTFSSADSGFDASTLTNTVTVVEASGTRTSTTDWTHGVGISDSGYDGLDGVPLQGYVDQYTLSANTQDIPALVTAQKSGVFTLAPGQSISAAPSSSSPYELMFLNINDPHDPNPPVVPGPGSRAWIETQLFAVDASGQSQLLQQSTVGVNTFNGPETATGDWYGNYQYYQNTSSVAETFRITWSANVQLTSAVPEPAPAGLLAAGGLLLALVARRRRRA